MKQDAYTAATAGSLQAETSSTSAWRWPASIYNGYQATGGGITTPEGFQAGTAHSGLKRKREDTLVLHSEAPAAVAALFTTNQVQAAPVQVSRQQLENAGGSNFRALAVCSGNANACTGPEGLGHAQQMLAATAAALGCSPAQCLVASTGLIGVPLPVTSVCTGIQQAAAKLTASPEIDDLAAGAIMTTDTFIKLTAWQCDLPGTGWTIGGIAKGSGMIHPRLGTMLAFITTDAAVTPAVLQQALSEVTQATFNRISVDGDTSTNDTVTTWANGLAGNELIDSQEHPLYEPFVRGLQLAAGDLASAVVRDGEGASKLVRIEVTGAASDADAETIARAVANSSLVKTAIYGADANWGRILSAAGSSGAAFDPSRVDISLSSPGLSPLQVAGQGAGLAFDEGLASAILAQADVVISLDLNQGAAGTQFLTSDLSHEYVTINASYRS